MDIYCMHLVERTCLEFLFLWLPLPLLSQATSKHDSSHPCIIHTTHCYTIALCSRHDLLAEE